jgi:hypothetical protein
MRTIKQTILTLGITALIGCGGGGGGGSGACSALKINGGESCEGGAPTVAAVISVSKDGREEICTGTLISQTSILTAAHCVEGRPKEIVVAVPGHTRKASQYFIHPGYRSIRYGSSFGLINDLAIIKFSEPIPVGPAPILVSKGAPASGEEVVAYGFGVDEQGQSFVGRFNSGDVPLKATYLIFSGVNSGLLYETVSSGSGNTCKGDSGGPIVARNANGQWGIIAVTSFSPLVSFERPCIPTQGGTLAVQSPVQNNDAMNFILSVAPDAALN